MKNTGSLLKSKRESSKLSLSEVALATKINPKILAAIENGEDSALPAMTILKGFVRSYALFLKMDVDEVMRTFQEETGGVPTVERPAAEVARQESSGGGSRRRVDEEGSSGMRTAAVIVIVLLIGLIIGVRELIEKYQREKVVEASTDIKVSPLAPEQQAKTDAAPAVTATATPAVEEASAEKDEDKAESEESREAAATSPAPSPLPPPNPAPVAAAPAVVPNLLATPVKAPEPAKPAEPAKAAPTADTVKPAAETVKPTETVAAPAGEAKPQPAIKEAKHEIILEAIDKVEVKFQVKGETKRVSLGPTQVHTIHADQPLTLDLSDGGAVNIILDGRERGVPGDLGKPKTIKIP